MEEVKERKDETVYRTYAKRWLVLLVVIFLNLSGAMVWLTFVAVAYRAASFYETSLFVINWLALIFNLSGVLVGAIATYVLEKYGLKVALILSAWLTGVGACIRIASAIPSLSSDEKLAVLFVGQVLVALGQPFATYAPAKTASTWFPEHQRAIATTIGAVSNPIGVVIAGISAPFFVSSITDELDALNLLITMAVPAAFTIILTTFTMTTKAPPTPPSAGALEKGGYFGSGLKEAFKNKNFVILFFAIGGALGLYSTFATLLEQFLCPFGYTDVLAGICAAAMTGAGVIGAFIIGVIVDKTKQFSTAVKASYIITAAGLIVFCVLFHTYIDYYILIMVGLIGLFSFGIYPIGVELAVEAIYPVGVATSSGLIMMSGQIQSILLVSILQIIGRVMSLEETIKYNSQCHPIEEVIGTTHSLVGFTEATNAPPLEETIDLSVSVYVCGGYFGLLALILVFFFRPKYNRMAIESKETSSSTNEKSEGYTNEGFNNSLMTSKIELVTDL